ncbi:putative proteasome activator complex subunit 4 [Calycina marina]|uniref:Proteasome activator complex subunit 4 n=1 Tax=Calycina marina TaxID=1763456 RepID=A0A9P7Z1J3_9HELO|nr:putative proteasome activator complex subunit 4 [Calycina marina]
MDDGDFKGQALRMLVHNGGYSDGVSRATSPGLGDSSNATDTEKEKRYRPRTFPYFKLLPYNVEEESERNAALEEILKQLYIAVKAEDIAPGATHWTRELRGWLNLKFEIPRALRAKLAKLYYMLALAPGVDAAALERFESMFRVLTKRRHYLKSGEDLILDWRPLWKEIKQIVLPGECPPHQSSRKRSHKNIANMCSYAYAYFDPRDRKAMLDEILPYFSTSDTTGAFVVMGALNFLMPTLPSPNEPGQLQPQDYLPTFFHLWSLVNRSKTFDTIFFDFLSRLARDSLTCKHVQFSEYGIFTKEQSDLMYTALLRLTEIPVGQSTSCYSAVVDHGAGLAMYLEKDKRKNPLGYSIARWISMSLSPACLDKPGSILFNLEGLMESIDTFYHPSNQGAWTNILAQIVFHLQDFFVMRYNREVSGELDTPPERRINDELKERFVLSLKEVMFMGLFSKSGKPLTYFYNAIQGLAYLEPHLILPGALQRFYPSLQGLVEVHRTQSSLVGLQMIANVMSKEKGFRCHISATLALALPGIDANDLTKTHTTLNFIQAVAYSIPFVDLTKGREDNHGSLLAGEWVQGEIDRMEQLGPNASFDYREELSDEEEATIARSSTAGFGEFVLALLGKIFTLLENIPELSRVRSGSPEENVINTLPAALTPLFTNLSPEILDKAMEKIASFVSGHVIHQARDAMAFICNALCKASPEKTLKRFVPMLIAGIRSEIDDNNAASDRSSGVDVLPRDRALVWHISMLSMIIVHVGDAIMPYKKDLFDIAVYMQEKCKGIPTVHISNYIHHLLLNLTLTYPVDANLYEPEVMERGIDIGDWGRMVRPNDLTIKWHLPSQEEIAFAVELFDSQVETAVARLTNLISDTPAVSRKGTNKEWSDEVSRNLSQLRLILSGINSLFDPNYASRLVSKSEHVDTTGPGGVDPDAMDIDTDDDPLAETTEDESTRPQFHYHAGYLLDKNSDIYHHIHKHREEVGHLLSEIHAFLVEHQEDDVACFTALYTAYRTFITDVGTERSAHTLERITKLYQSDVRAFKISGKHKPYPRPLLIRRASIYHFQRAKHNCTTRRRSDLDDKLLLDLASSCVSLYAEVRVHAQAALESSLKSLIGGRPLVIPPLLEALKKALNVNDFDRIKGSLYILFYSSLTKTIAKDWRYAPELIRLYIMTASVDKASIQKISASALYGGLLEYGRPLEMYMLIDQDLIQALEPSEDCSSRIASRHRFLQGRRRKVEAKKQEVAHELVTVSQNSHWKIAVRCTIFIHNAGLRFQTLAPHTFIDLAVKGTVDEHPGLRNGYGEMFSRIFNQIETRATYGHSYEKFIREEETPRGQVKVQVENGNEAWTQRFLDAFTESGTPEYFVERDYPGWLVWNKSFKAVTGSPELFTDYDELETAARQQIGALLTREWYSKYFAYMKQEPRDSSSDRFRIQHAGLLNLSFNLMHSGQSAATFEDIQDLIKETFEDGSDKHQHRATSEILAGLLLSAVSLPTEMRNKVWCYGVPILLKAFAEGLTPENHAYWMTCLHLLISGKDPRQVREIIDSLSAFRLDMHSDTAFKESSKIQLLEFAIQDAGWHFRQEKPILEDFLAHIDHPYKSVREAIGRSIAAIYRTRYYESFKDVQTLLDANRNASSIGIKPYQPEPEFAASITDVFNRLKIWRGERTPGQTTGSSYTSGSKTVLLWLDATLQSQECTQLLDFFPDVFMEELLHMMDVKEDPELQQLAYLVFRHLPNIPFRVGEDGAFISALIRIGKTAASWHQRLRSLINMQVIYFRRIFLIKSEQQQQLFDAVAEMLEDPQHEVRMGASTTLAGMIRCSPVALRDLILPSLQQRFTEAFKDNPMPKKTPGTGTPISSNIKVVRRHAAVLGLGALVTAFPYATPPPPWMPEILALLASRASNDAGAIGKAVKTILAEFKKTRQDTWMTDQKAFTPEQLEDLEGVLWKSYFA